MEINRPAPATKKVLDYDFHFTNGVTFPVILDQAAGDTILFDPDLIHVHLASKPSLSDSDVFLPAEDLTIFRQHVIYIQSRTREALVNPMAEIEWQKVLQTINATPQ